ncbi:hypothetical protein BKA65DRAFT_563764 [Rhexocercosporidium sp. MPI-PUGE-AT-0058]|nr:hypothetical protein BKA65DRAFT_563764 [Rhexocercosporidium sp. MPI-PUGE-AT-0058]
MKLIDVFSKDSRVEACYRLTMATSAQLEAEYALVVSELAHENENLKPRTARGLDRFKSLDAFLRIRDLPNKHSHSELMITIVTFYDNGTCESFGTRYLEKLSDQRDLKWKCSEIGHCREPIPQSCEDARFNVTKTPEQKQPAVIHIPWYNIEKVDPDLPVLASLKSENRHILIRFIGAKEYEGGFRYTQLERRGLSPIYESEC